MSDQPSKIANGNHVNIGSSPSTRKIPGLPSLREVISLPEIQKGHPIIEAGSSELGRTVRWVHVSELVDIGALLEGGELILSTGIALPNSQLELTRYIDELNSAGVAGLIIELGRKFTQLPPILVKQAALQNMPLISLRTEVQFVTITQAVHSIIVNSEIKQLQLRETIHNAFRNLAIEATQPQDIIDRMAELANCPVIFESVNRHVLAHAQTHSKGDQTLQNWEARSLEAGFSPYTDILGIDRWLTTPVAARGHHWGRLIFMTPSPAASHLRTIIEQGATTLSLHLLLDRDQSLLEHQTHRTLIGDIIGHRYSSAEEIHSRTQALGMATKRNVLMGLIILFDDISNSSDIDQHSRTREIVIAISRALSDIKTPGLVGSLSPTKIALLLSIIPNKDQNLFLEQVALAIRHKLSGLSTRVNFAIGVGSSTSSIDNLRQSFAEAEEAAVAGLSSPEEKLYTTTADIHLRGLIYLLRDDQHLQRFAERELGVLIAYDNHHKTQLVDTLAAYLKTGGNKSLAAKRANIGRATLYSHLQRIEEILKCDLEDPDWRYSLVVALLACNCMALEGPL